MLALGELKGKSLRGPGLSVFDPDPTIVVLKRLVIEHSTTLRFCYDTY